MNKLMKSISLRMLVEVNKRMGIIVEKNVEDGLDNEIMETLKDIIYVVLDGREKS